MRWFPPDPVSPAAKRASLAAADQSHAATAAAAKGRIFSEAVISCVRAVTQRRRFAAGRIRSASDVCGVLGRALILPRQRSGKRVRSNPPSRHCLPDRDSALVRNGRACAATVYGFRFQSSRDKPRSPSWRQHRTIDVRGTKACRRQTCRNGAPVAETIGRDVWLFSS